MIDKNLLTVGLRGSFKLKEPYVIDSDEEYYIGSVQTFKEMMALGLSPYKLVYRSVGIAEDIAMEEDRSGVVIVKLISVNYDPIYVPNTYIRAIPSGDQVNYQHVVLGVSLGLLPSTIDLSHIVQAVAETVELYLGHVPETHLAVHPSTGVITATQHVALERSRQATIKNKRSLLAMYREQVSLNQGLTDRIEELETMLDNILNP